MKDGVSKPTKQLLTFFVDASFYNFMRYFENISQKSIL